MGSTNPVLQWFGNLKLAYKYGVVFIAILLLTMLAGFIKVLFNRRKLNKAVKKEQAKDVSDDNVELNLREKDEGDLFGIRAIEAGFYAGVAQSRPTSRRTSIQEKSNTTSIVSNNSPFHAHSSNNSVRSIHLGVGSDTTSQRRLSPPSKLIPSEAEMSGRRNHNGIVDMSLNVAPSPARSPTTPTFGGSQSSSENRSPSPRSADFNPEHYSPAPMVPMPESLQVSYHTGYDIKSQTASYTGSRTPSPTPPSPGGPPSSRLPTIPQNAYGKGSRSPSPTSLGPQVRIYQPNHEPESFLPSFTHVQAPSSAPNHKRDDSDTSLYSNVNRLSAFQAYQAYQQHAGRSSVSPPGWEEPSRGSTVLSVDKAAGRASGRVSSYLIPAPQLGGNDSRLSDFYDAYYRQSHLGLSTSMDFKQFADRQSTIMEVDSPMPSPLLPKMHQPGAAF